ncbi:pimeloyl-CoA dehydrogenase small subunit [Sphingobium lactosutens]|uniref:acyl-CoA dehydrogenase family protein n=1 Tax=Sphingobium lactosutens TaxID=522773 RepID=UPI0015B90195|nr:acyl-CoA dehydrogenase family protein [Sphingobium lactosutens]NWK99146.1 pimeloyl-CoA dehydrogenase small subunit [Sphingobium lactosutens]
MSILCESQEMLGDLVGRYLIDNFDFEARQATMRLDGWPSDLWRAFADELGILGLPFAEAKGGLGLGPLDTMVVMEQLGRALAAEPFLSSVVGFGALVNNLEAAEAGALASLIGRVIGGEARIALAVADDGGQRTLTRGADGWRLKGSAPIIPSASDSTHVAISAETTEGGTALIVTERNADGLIWSAIPLIDGTSAGGLELDALIDDAAVITLRGKAAIAVCREAQLAALSAEITGIITALIEMTVDFAKQRTQFGKTLSSFQVLQHRMADMYVEGELTRSMGFLAALKLDAPAAERSAAVAAAKARAGKAGRMVAQNAIQIHGGIGTTDELIVGHYFKRLLAIEALYGSADSHIKRYADHRADLGQPIPVV